MAGPRVPYLSLLPELLRALMWRMMRPLRVWWRRTWFYRRFLKGPLSDRILFHPYDAMPRRLEDADALLRGRFRFHGEMVEAPREGSIFDVKPPSADWERALHSFVWLPPLALAGGEPARALATNLITQWLKRHSKYSEPAWSPEITARRLIHLFAHGRLVIANSDLLWRSKVFVSLREQSRMLARIAGEAPDGMPRFEAAAAMALSGACLGDSQRRLEEGLKRLEGEIARQILPDGGHVSRSPENLVHCYRLIMMVMDALTSANLELPQAIRSGYDRIAPAIRFFRHGDGALALFNGGTECDPKTVAGLLARDEVRGRPFDFARHSAYQRLAAGRSLLVLDCGTAPPGPFAREAHAACLAFEFSNAGQRIVVNCGAAGASQPKWESALRATAAHSTLTLADQSQAAILPQGLARKLLGARLLLGPSAVETRRTELAQGWSAEASHDAYVPAFGVRHERQVTMGVDGLTVTGADRVLPKAGMKNPKDTPFAIRFHIHPDVRITPSQGGGILLKLPNGEGWRFRAGGQIGIEESVYLGSDQVRRTEQIVLSGSVKDQPVEVAWVFEQIGAG